MSVYEKDFDEILTEILTDYANLSDSPDISVGSNPWLMASVLASMLWGLYKYQDYISEQHFPDTADTDNLNHWGSIYDITRDDDDTDATYLNKILDRLRQPPAGGNAVDYENWCLDQDECYYVSGDSTYYNSYVTVVDAPSSVLGTVNLYTISSDDTNSAISAGLRVATQTYIDSVRPIGMIGAYVYDATPQSLTLDLTITQDATVNTNTMKAAMVTDMSSMAPGETWYNSSIIATAINYGAESCVVDTPSSDSTTPDALHFFRSGTADITISVS
jgi:uncharacterized phage protein gp47/JayE